MGYSQEFLENFGVYSIFSEAFIYLALPIKNKFALMSVYFSRIHNIFTILTNFKSIRIYKS